MWSPRLKNVASKIAPLLEEIEKIIKTVATICRILLLKCTKIQFRLVPRPDPIGAGAYKAPPDLLAGFEGAYF